MSYESFIYLRAEKNSSINFFISTQFVFRDSIRLQEQIGLRAKPKNIYKNT